MAIRTMNDANNAITSFRKFICLHMSAVRCCYELIYSFISMLGLFAKEYVSLELLHSTSA